MGWVDYQICCIGTGGSMNRPTRFYSSKQEKKVAKVLGGKTVSNSGAPAFVAGDVTLNDWLIECKTTTATSKASFSIKKEWLEKNKEEAFAVRKQHSALAFRFGADEEDYYIISEKEFKNYLELLGQIQS